VEDFGEENPNYASHVNAINFRNMNGSVTMALPSSSINSKYTLRHAGEQREGQMFHRILRKCATVILPFAIKSECFYLADLI
jgi:hypothetical protein